MSSARPLLSWPGLFSELLIFGTTTFALTLDEHGRGRSILMTSFFGLWRIAAVLDVLFSPLLLLEIGSGMAGVGWTATWPLMPQILSETYAGRIWRWRLGVVVLMGVMAFWPMRSWWRAMSLAVASAVLLFLGSLTSHAIDHGSDAVFVYLIHECAAALWLGAVLSLWWGAKIGRGDDRWIDQVAPWASRLAGWTVLVLVLSGSFTAYLFLVGEPVRIFYSAYGRTLLIKVGAAAIILMIGAYNRFILMAELTGSAARRNLVRNVGVESVMLAGVVYIAALLANTPPAH
jgi:copper transport protein